MAQFERTRTVAAEPASVLDLLAAAVLVMPEYRETREADTIVFTRRYRPRWATVLAVVGTMFVIGAPLWLIKVTDTFTVRAAAVPNGSQVTITGDAPPETIARCVLALVPLVHRTQEV